MWWMSGELTTIPSEQSACREFVKKLMDLASRNEHSEYKEIQSYLDYNLSIEIARLTRKISQNFKKDANDAFNKYFDLMKSGVEDCQLLFQHRRLLDSAKFFDDEVTIINEALYDCRCYMRELTLFDKCRFMFNNEQRSVLDEERASRIEG